MGAGPAGALSAIYMAQQNYDVEVYKTAPYRLPALMQMCKLSKSIPTGPAELSNSLPVHDVLQSAQM